MGSTVILFLCVSVDIVFAFVLVVGRAQRGRWRMVPVMDRVPRCPYFVWALASGCQGPGRKRYG